MIDLIVGLIMVALVVCILIVSIYPEGEITYRAWFLIALSLFIGICHVAYTIVCEFIPIERIY
jgi:hypothetical protein